MLFFISDRFDVSRLVGLICVCLVLLAVVLSTVPSMIVTTLKFRSGALSSLRDPGFKAYRKGIHGVSYLLGGAIWGSLISSIVVFIFAYILTFISVFKVSAAIFKNMGFYDQWTYLMNLSLLIV